MEPTEKPKFNWTRLIITIVIVLVTAGALGGGVWYYMNQQTVKAEDAKNKEVAELQKQIDDLKKSPEAGVPTSASTVEKTIFTSDQGFSLSYGKDWTTRSLAAGVRLTKGNNYIDVISFNNPSALSLDAWLSQEIRNGNIGESTIQDKLIKTVGQYQALYFQHNGMGVNYYYILGSGSKMIQITSSYESPASIKAEMEEFVKTIKFS